MLLTVAAAGGDHATVRDALAVAEPGARIVVRAGRYVGDLRLDKPVALVGEGGRDAVVLQGSVTITGECELRGVTIAEPTGHGLIVRGPKANPLVADVRVHDGAQIGLYVTAGARGRFERCDLSGSGWSNVEIRDAGSEPTLCHCRIADGKRGGI